MVCSWWLEKDRESAGSQKEGLTRQGKPRLVIVHFAIFSGHLIHTRFSAYETTLQETDSWVGPGNETIRGAIIWRWRQQNAISLPQGRQRWDHLAVETKECYQPTTREA